jgi:hypothetical protein
MEFYKSDQSAIPDGWHYIGIGGKEIVALTNGELHGILVRYSYIKGSDEFLLDLEGNQLGINDTVFFARFDYGDDTLIIRRNYYKDGKTIAEIQWKDTKRKRLDGIKISKEFTPRNVIRAIIKELYKQKIENR